MKKKANILDEFKKVDVSLVDKLLLEEIKKCDRKIVVLDDDPTGVQTVHGVYVYTDWTKESITRAFLEENNLFYILTNSRGMTIAETTLAHTEIAQTVACVSKETGKDFVIISRGDSTLRGHYPLETNILKSVIESKTDKKIDGEIICPFFKEGGRFTIDDIHFVKYGDELIPSAETEFAKDKTFGYENSDLKLYVQEKTKGEFKACDTISISLEEIRNLEIDKITKKLMDVSDFNKIIINAIDYTDVKIACVAIYRALNNGKNFMFRTAAAIVKAIGGISDKPLLTRADMVVKEIDNGGIVVVGSHTKKTTEQLEKLKTIDELEFVEFNSDLVLDDELFQKEIVRVIKKEEELIESGKTVVVYTKRKLLTFENDTKEAALIRSVKISDAVQSLVGKLKVTPSFVVAKGGITSSDVGTKALQVKRANVLGQIRPGIPVWQTGDESKYPKTPYVIFPGNVGETTTLKEAVSILLK